MLLPNARHRGPERGGSRGFGPVLLQTVPYLTRQHYPSQSSHSSGSGFLRGFSIPSNSRAATAA